MSAPKPSLATPQHAHSGDWSKVPTINPDDLVGKTVFPIMADLTETGEPYTGIDSDQIKHPVALQGGPGYSFIPINTQHGIVWAVQGKRRGSFKLGKDADYAVVTTMNPDTHQSNATFSNALIRTAMAHAQSGRLGGNSLATINDMIRSPTSDPNHAALRNFPGLEHPDAEEYAKKLNFESRKRITDVLASPKAQEIGAPNVNKITRRLLDKNFAGVNRSQALFLLKLDKSANNMVHLKEAGLPEHHSYDYGLKGTVVGKFHHPVAAQTLWKEWFDRKGNQDPNHVRRAFDLELPVGTVTPEIASMLPRSPKYMQSPQAAHLALHIALDRWHDTDTPVKEGGLSPTVMSNALKNSDSSSTLSQYSPEDIKKMVKEGKFKGYKLHDGEVYFGLKKGTDYGEEYGFHHPELTNNETALTSVVNNEPGAKGIGGPAVVLKAIKEGATALDAYAVPSAKHPNGFLPDYYSHFGFKELGRIPFDPKYVSPQQFEDMKHHWRANGWDERMGLPSLAIMKWKGNDNDRYDALRRHLGTGRPHTGFEGNQADVEAADKRIQWGAVPHGGASRNAPYGDQGGNLGSVRNGSQPRPTERLSRTISAATAMSPQEASTFGVEPELVAKAKAAGFKRGGIAKALRLTAGLDMQPTDAQKAAGNYRKDHISFQGLPISIETRKGQMRSGTGPDGRKWAVKLPYDYGYIKRTEGADGDHVDVCIGPDAMSDHVFIVDQHDHKTGRFDEHKVMLGYRTKSEAEHAYRAGFSDGKGHLRMRSVVAMTMGQFKDWLKRCDTKKPVRGQGHIERALSAASVYSGNYDRDAG